MSIFEPNDRVRPPGAEVTEFIDLPPEDSSRQDPFPPPAPDQGRDAASAAPGGEPSEVSRPSGVGPPDRRRRTVMARRVLRGALAGAGATIPMTAFMLGARRAGLMRGPQAPAEIVDEVLPAPVRPALHRPVTAAAHLGFGAGAGAAFALVRPDRVPLVPAAIGWALGVWAVSYAGWIPAFDLLAPPHEDRPGRPAVMIGAHVVYGIALAGLLEVTDRH